MAITSREVASKDDPIYKSGVTITMMKKSKKACDEVVEEKKPETKTNAKEIKNGLESFFTFLFFVFFSFSIVFNLLLLDELFKHTKNLYIAGYIPSLGEHLAPQLYVINYAGIVGFSIIPTLVLAVIIYYIRKALLNIRFISLKDNKKTFVIDNKSITKIAIILLITWLIISFNMTNHHTLGLEIEDFLAMQIPAILIFGYLWLSNRLTVK